jgi:hypothetical protein
MVWHCRGVPRVVDVHLGGITASRGLKLAAVRGLMVRPIKCFDLSSKVVFQGWAPRLCHDPSDGAKDLEVKNQDIASPCMR